MLKTRSFFAVDNVRHALIVGLVALFMSFGFSPAAQAVEVPTLFTAEVPVDEDSDDPRNDAYKAALLEVLTRVSGPGLSGNIELIEQLFPRPASYVTQFRSGADDSLWVSFDGDAIEKVLRGAGQIVWGSDRPLTLVWLAVDWGQGERQIIAAADADNSRYRSRSIDRNRLLRERMLEIAQSRGLPLAFPLLDTTDLRNVAFSDIWGGFHERILDASRRYDANSILIGRVRASSGQRNRWTYFFGGEERNWTAPPEVIVGRIADMLAAEFAVGGDAPLEIVALSVSGVASVDDYGSVQHLLAGVSLIENFRIEEVSGDTVNYQVEVRGGADRLRRALRFAGLLEQEAVIVDDILNPDPLSALLFFYSD